MNKNEKKLLNYFEDSIIAKPDFQRIEQKMDINLGIEQRKSNKHFLKTLTLVNTFLFLLMISIIIPFTNIQISKNSQNESNILTTDNPIDNTQEAQLPEADLPTLYYQGIRYNLMMMEEGKIDMNTIEKQYLGSIDNYDIYLLNSNTLIVIHQNTKMIYEMIKISEN